MSVSPEWVGIGITAVGAAMGVGRLWQKVSDGSKHHDDCRIRREKMEQRIFDELKDLSQDVNKIKGGLGLNGD